MIITCSTGSTFDLSNNEKYSLQLHIFNSYLEGKINDAEFIKIIQNIRWYRSHNSLITNESYFPRCEYYTRFLGTTAFDMHDPSYWNTYHRSRYSRFSSKVAGTKKKAYFSSPFLTKTPKAHSFYAHTGGFHSPFTFNEYSNDFRLEEQVDEASTNVRDKLLLYKNKMANIVVESFRMKTKEQRHLHRIVYAENNYPCVLVALPTHKYWKRHPKPFQKLLLCCFIAILNVEAMKANIPIEMVIRASFGHNLPSACVMESTFRINVGLVPTCYAELIGKALYQLYQMISQINYETSDKISFDDTFLNQVRAYNINKIKLAIKENKLYHGLILRRDYLNCDSSTNFDNLYRNFCNINKKNKRKGGANFVPVDLKNKTIWEVIRGAGDCMGKSVLSECFRKNGTEDWFVNKIMEALLENLSNPIERALCKLINCIRYTNDKVSMDYQTIHSDLREAKRTFDNNSFQYFYDNDPEFSNITNSLFEALCSERPTYSLYYALDIAGINFFVKAKGSENIQDNPDFGSSSEFSVGLNDGKGPRIVHRKLRLCSGMKAILLAQYGALSYLYNNGRTCSISTDATQMYYEVQEALKFVSNPKPDIKRKIPNILYFDLNHCNAQNSSDNQTLEQKLAVSKAPPIIIILDYTSATALEVKEALRLSFSIESVQLVMLVDSGLKNNQGGLDINPYGEIRICARERNTVIDLSREMETVKVLAEQDKLPQIAHEKVRACKRRGMGFSLFGLFKTNDSRFQPIEIKQDSQKKLE